MELGSSLQQSVVEKQWGMRWDWLPSIYDAISGVHFKEHKSLYRKESLQMAHYINLIRSIQKEVDSVKADELEGLLEYLKKKIPMPYIKKTSNIKGIFKCVCPTCGKDVEVYEGECSSCGQRVISPEDIE